MKKKDQIRLQNAEKELQEETRKNGGFSKRAIFLKSVINGILNAYGKKDKYTW